MTNPGFLELLSHFLGTCRMGSTSSVLCLLAQVRRHRSCVECVRRLFAILPCLDLDGINDVMKLSNLSTVDFPCSIFNTIT